MMKKATLQFLQRERDELVADIRLLECGARDVIEIIDTVRRNVTTRALARMRDRQDRFEEMIAAYEARLA